MLAVTAWLPGGLENGVRLLGLSTSTLLSLAVATGVAVAAVVLVRSARVPRGVRIGITLLAAYAVIAFFYGAAAGVPFTSLLSGNSFWRRLPLLLQGAAVGALIVVPAALIAVAIRVGTRHPSRGSAEHGLYQAVALTTTLAIAVAALPHRGTGANAHSDLANDLARRLALLDNSLRAIEDGDRGSPRDRWDPDYIVQQVGKEPEALFTWVRDNTFWIPYRGMLRGPVGVLMDRQGNSLDRALLLARLLEAAGHTVRLAHGEISRTLALDLLPDLVAQHSVRLTTASDSDIEPDRDISAVAAQYQLNGEAIERGIAAQDNHTAQLVVELQTRVADQTGRLLSVVPRPDGDVEWLARYQTAVDALRDHWWVQCDERGTWSDLDLLAPPATKQLISAHETPAPNAVPSELRHNVAVRVVVEHWSSGLLGESQVLEHVLHPSELFGQTIALQFWPGSWPREINPDPNSRFGLRATALEQREWMAALIVGRDAVAQGVIRQTAGTREPPQGNPFGGLGAAISRHSQASTAPLQELTAAWIEYEVHAPAAPPRTIRRSVFDLLGAAMRSDGSVPQPALSEEQRLTRSLSLMMRTEILALASAPAPEFVTHLSAQSLIGNRDLLRMVARDEIDPAEQSTQQLLANAAPAVTPLYALALARTEWSGVRGDLYSDRIHLFSRHRYPAFASNELVLRDAIDIVATEMAVTLAQPDAFAIRLEQGVLDTNAEALLHASPVGRGSTGEAFKVSQSWVVLTPTQLATAGSLDLPAEAQRAITLEVQRGYTVVAPRAPVQIGSEGYIGWWRIDPATGDALGIAANGWGQSMAERGVQYNVMAEWAKTFAFEYAFCHAVPQVANQAVIFLQPYRDELPPWLPPLAQAQDPSALYKTHQKSCLIGAMIATGVTATLPMLLAFLRGYAARLARELGPFWRDQRGGIRIPPKWVGGPGEGRGRGPVNPFGKTEPDLSKTQVNRGAAPPPPAGRSAPGRSSGPLTREAAQENLAKAATTHQAARAKAADATGEYVRYRVNNPAREGADPSKWDPKVDEKLYNDMLETDRKSIEALNEWREANAAMKAADRAAADARRAQGQSGLAPQRSASPKFPGCPPNCGNDNPTGPAGEVQVRVGSGSLGGGS